jgi:hypothetical protein
MIRILLLDADGVMVQPAGYRAALRSTVNYFIGPPLALEEESLTELERRRAAKDHRGRHGNLWGLGCRPLELIGQILGTLPGSKARVSIER